MSVTVMEKHSRTFGILIGVLFYFFFISIIYLIELLLSVSILNLKNPAMHWLFLGTVPVFIGFGLYIFKDCKLWELKSSIFGFVVWFFIILVLQSIQFQISNYSYYTTLAGFILMLVFYFLFKSYQSETS